MCLFFTGTDSLQSAFDEIFRGRMSIIVIAVGFKLDDVKKEILTVFDDPKKYRPANLQVPPIMESFTFKDLNDKKFDWTQKSTQVVENDVAECLKYKSPFVFYRHGLYSGLSCNLTRAAYVVCREICWDHYLLVTGNDIELEEELKQDIQIVAAVAGMRNDNFFKFTEKDCNIYYGEKAVYTLLVDPSAEILKQTIEKAILLCNSAKLTIIYSGHGDEDGSWVLSGDDKFSGFHLLETLKHVQPQHYPKIEILLNSCYGFAFAEKIEYLSLLNEGLNLDLPEILRKYNAQVPETIKGIDIADRAKKYVSDMPVFEDLKNWLKVSECITRAVHKIIQAAGIRVAHSKYLSYSISVLPFSAGLLDACGILPELYLNKTEDINIEWSKARAHQKSWKPNRNPVKESIPSNPYLVVFPGANGDSTLFRWGEFNMLVDGGLKSFESPPCFWSTVSQLPKNQALDVVVVTHYDEDHIKGVLSLFKKKSLPIQVKKLYTATPVEAPKSRSAKQGTSLYKCALRHKVKTMDLVTDPTTPIFTEGNLRIFMLTPEKNDLDKAKKLMSILPSRLTIPNLASASLLIECKIRKQYKYALLTGDAPGKAIIKGLQRVKAADCNVKRHLYLNDRYNFTYVDMPHHGSKHNDPREFLDNITTEVCVISANGKYGHPDDQTLKELCHDSTSVKNLLFTYKKNVFRKNFMHFKENFKGKKYEFAHNLPDSETNCWLVNVASGSFTEKECDRVIKFME